MSYHLGRANYNVLTHITYLYSTTECPTWIAQSSASNSTGPKELSSAWFSKALSFPYANLFEIIVKDGGLLHLLKSPSLSFTMVVYVFIKCFQVS